MVTTIKVLLDQVVRKPDGLLLAYPCLNLASEVSRPLPVVTRCGANFVV